MKKSATSCAQSILAAAVCGLASLSSIARADLYTAWSYEYNPNTNYSQRASAVTVDARGNVIVTGAARDVSDNYDRYYTAKYDAIDGHLLWQAIFGAGSQSAKPSSVVTDSAGNVIVTGTINTGSAIDAYTIKYSGSSGQEAWHVQYNGPNGGIDEGIRVVVDSNDDVIMTAKVAGVVNGNFSGADIYTFKYHSADGTAAWNQPNFYSSAGNSDDFPTGLVLDSDDNVIVVGDVRSGSNRAFYLRKIATGGTTSWEKIIDSGGVGGGTAVTVDSSNNIYATGLYTDGSDYRGYYTVKYNSGGVAAANWPKTLNPPSPNLTGGPTGIAVTFSGNVIVTGWLENNAGDETAYTVGYSSTGTTTFGPFIDNGPGVGDTRSRGLITDGSSNTIIIGESDYPGATGGTQSEIYVAKYSADLSKRLQVLAYAGNRGTDDVGAAIAPDGSGGAAIAGTVFDSVNGTGYNKLVTVKLGRFIVNQGDALPNAALFTTGNAPAVADNGSVVALINGAAGAVKSSAILSQTAIGKSTLAAVSKGPAGNTGGTFVSFSDPIIAPNGQYAFAAKLAAAGGASSVWTNLGGAFHLSLQQGVAVPAVTDKLASVMSLSMRNSQLVALVKLTSAANNNLALVGLNSANAGTKLMRTNDPVSVNNVNSTIKSFITLSPTLTSPGDGRWHGDTNVLTLATLADKRTVLYRINTAGGATAMLYSGQDASTATGIMGSTWKSFGKPAVSGAGTRFATLGTLNLLAGKLTAANDTALVYSANGLTFSAFALEGGTPNDNSLNTLTYAGFSEPLVNSTGDLAFIATLKGTGVTAKNNKALLFGPFADTYKKIARLGDGATNSAGNSEAATWAAFTSFVLPGGADTAPVFLAKLAGTGVTPKNNLGIWAVSSAGKTIRILRSGDLLGERTVASFNLLKALPTVFAAPRSANSNGTVAAQVVFTDKTQALVKLSVP